MKLFSTLTTLLTAASLASSYRIDFYADPDCKNHAGQVSGRGDFWSTISASYECNAPPRRGARSFIARMDGCQTAIIHFGGQRKMGKGLCAAGGFMCQYSYTIARPQNWDGCTRHPNGWEITGWQLQVNQGAVRNRNIQCGNGFRKRDLEAREERSSPRDFDFGKLAAEEPSIEEVVKVIEERGAENEAEERLVKRQRVTC